jgi:putative transposase
MQARKSLGASATFKTRFIESVQVAASRVAAVVKRPDFAKGFVLPPTRWRVEQSIGALTGSCRLELDYETLTHASAAAMSFASITRLLASITME